MLKMKFPGVVVIIATFSVVYGRYHAPAPLPVPSHNMAKRNLNMDILPGTGPFFPEEVGAGLGGGAAIYGFNEFHLNPYQPQPEAIKAKPETEASYQSPVELPTEIHYYVEQLDIIPRPRLPPPPQQNMDGLSSAGLGLHSIDSKDEFMFLAPGAGTGAGVETGKTPSATKDPLTFLSPYDLFDYDFIDF